MLEHETHAAHDHEHVKGKCEHPAVKHDGHVDFLHDGHLHNVHDGHVDEHRLSVDDKNSSACTGGHTCAGHLLGHEHSATCGHQAVPHGEHVDYLVGSHIHHPHEKHCDSHGELARA